MKNLFVLVAALGVSSAQAFLPPINETLNEIFASRKSSEAVELVFRHAVQVKEGETVDVIETFLGNRSGAIVRWQIAGQPEATSEWNAREFAFRSGKSVPSRTGAFIDVFLADGSGDYLDRLLRERFLRRDQLLQFKPGYQPQGDPKTWDAKGNYLLHDDVFLVKNGKDFGVAVVGMNEGDQKRTVVFGKTTKGIVRLEWGVAGETAAWDFTGFASVPNLGRLPRTMSLSINGAERVRTTLASAKAVRRDALATARLASKQPSAAAAPSSELEEAVRLIVRYR